MQTSNWDDRVLSNRWVLKASTSDVLDFTHVWVALISDNGGGSGKQPDKVGDDDACLNLLGKAESIRGRVGRGTRSR